VIVEIIERIGQPPLRIPASQVVVCLDDGTPVSLAAMEGEGVRVSHCLDSKFHSDLRKFGIHKTVIVDPVRLPPPPDGARLLVSPG